jgi:putative transposase
VIGLIDDHRKAYGIEPICRVLPIAPWTCHNHAAQRRDPSRISERAKWDETLKREVKRVCAQNFGVYGVRKVWWQLVREGFRVAPCTVERWMREMALKGVIRGKPFRSAIQDTAGCVHWTG